MQRQKQRATLIDVKREVESHKGDLIKLEAHKSKKKLYHKVGRIEAVYPSIFTVTVEAEKNRPAERLSFSYSDVLTRSVKIALINESLEDEALEPVEAMMA